jgi:hypothetical protein
MFLSAMYRVVDQVRFSIRVKVRARIMVMIGFMVNARVRNSVRVKFRVGAQIKLMQSQPNVCFNVSCKRISTGEFCPTQDFVRGDCMSPEKNCPAIVVAT